MRRLQIQSVGGKEGTFYRDNRLREFRATDNPHERVTFDEAAAEHGSCPECSGPLEAKSKEGTPACYDHACHESASWEIITSCCLAYTESFDVEACPECGNGDYSALTSCCHREVGKGVKDCPGCGAESCLLDVLVAFEAVSQQ